MVMRSGVIKIKKSNMWMLFAIFIACSFCIAAICINRSKGILKDGYENDDRMVSALISNVVDKAFLRPITVSETIANDYTTKAILDIKDQDAAIEIENHAADYLKSLRDGFGYSMVFAVSDPAKTYFTYNGISKYIDIEHDSRDAWYKNFLETDKTYRLDVDTDEAANWSLSVFINTAVYNDKKEFIGVTGVGVDMNELQKMLERYERIYDVKINLIDSTGLIQIDTDTSKIENEYIHIDNLEDYSDGECYYEILAKGTRTITYLENLDWYLVVQNNNVWIQQVKGMVLPCLLCLVITIILMIIVIKNGILKETYLENSEKM